jgi:hypothetical protein
MLLDVYRSLRQSSSRIDELRRRLAERIYRDGIGETAKYANRKLVDSFHEWRIGIVTRDYLELKTFGVTDPACGSYVPTDYTSFRKIMKSVEIKPNNDVFLDFGSGLGRTVIMAGLYPFKRIIGVELVSEFNDRALANIERVRNRLKCANIEIVQANAAEYVLPTDVTIVYFFSPFTGAILSQTLHNILDSWQASPRKLTIIFKNPRFFEAEALRHPWLSKRAEYFHLSEHKYVIYETPAESFSKLTFRAL